MGAGNAMLDRVLELLGNMSQRPGMFVHPANVTTVQSFLHGLETGCSIGGLTVSSTIYEAAAATRGWQWRAAGIVWHMREKNLNDESIIQELIAVAAESFRRTAIAGPQKP